MSMGKINSAESLQSTNAGSVIQRITEVLSNFAYCTRRQLSEQTGIEIATLCGALARMKKRGLIAEPFSLACEKTGKTVIYYRLNTSEVQA